MSKILFIIFFILNFNFIHIVYAQETAVPFLRIHPSPNLNGMAGAFTALPTNDVYGVFFNPAQLGNFSQDNNFALGFFPVKTDWLPNFNFSDLSFHAIAFAAGYKLQTKIPISLGFAYMYDKLDLGMNVWTDASGNTLGTFNSYETFHAFSVGSGIDYYLKFNLGLTVKYVNSELIPRKIVQVGAEYRNGNADIVAIDYGIQVIWPVISTIKYISNQLSSLKYKPFLHVSSGYSISNVGGKLTYIREKQSDPLPREARLGYGLSFGLETEYSNYNLNIIKFDISSEARDLLIEKDSEKINYQSMLGDIEISENVISGLSNEKVAVYQGWRIKMLDTFQYSSGRFKGGGFGDLVETNGMSISISGFLKWLSSENSNPNLNYLANHIDIEYAWSEYNTENSPIDGTRFKGMQITVFGF